MHAAATRPICTAGVFACIQLVSHKVDVYVDCRVCAQYVDTDPYLGFDEGRPVLVVCTGCDRDVIEIDQAVLHHAMFPLLPCVLTFHGRVAGSAGSCEVDEICENLELKLLSR